jgi:hypothetical protein
MHRQTPVILIKNGIIHTALFIYGLSMESPNMYVKLINILKIPIQGSLYLKSHNMKMEETLEAACKNMVLKAIPPKPFVCDP